MYSTATKSSDLFKKIIFCMRELHAVFAVLKTLGKIIYGSSLDKSFIETRIYGPNTVTQIKVYK